MSEIQDEGATTPRPVTVVVETEDNKTFKIGTADLGVMAAQLRGRSTFSPFNSIILPIGVTVLTAILTTAIGAFFQHISWHNTVALQEAQDRVTQATTAYTKAATAIGERYYATYTFLDAVGDLIERKQDVDSHLYQLDLELNKRRFNHYYDQIKLWNESNDQLLSGIDFDLDRPVQIKEHTRASTIDQIECNQYLTQQLKSHHLNPDSLKLQFAVITRCFAKGVEPFSQIKANATVDPKFNLDKRAKQDAMVALGSVMSSANVFRCYALNRIEFLKVQQPLSTYVPMRGFLTSIGLVHPAPTRENHFSQTESDCSISNEH